MIEVLLEKLDIPESCALNKRVFKKLFEENTKLDLTDKKALKDDVQDIRWLYTLKPSTIHIPPYVDDIREYLEVAILHVALASPARFKRIADFMQRAIPYPLVLLFSWGGSAALSLADKRINQADKTKWVIETSFETEWIVLAEPTALQRQFLDDLSLKKLSFLHFYALYQDLCQRVVALHAASHSGRYVLTFESGTNPQNRVQALREIQKLEQTQAELRNRLKKENQLGRQVELNGQIHKISEQLEQMKHAL